MNLKRQALSICLSFLSGKKKEPIAQWLERRYDQNTLE